MTHSATYLVTGGAGFIGSAFVAEAVARSCRLVVLDKLTYAGHRANLEGINISANSGSYELVVGDIADGELVTRLLQQYQPNAVINFAAESHVDNSIDAPADFIETNITGTYQLLQTSLLYWKNLSEKQKQAFRFVQISTDEVYGSLDATGAFTEHSPYLPNSPYSASKAAADHLARAWYHTYGLPVIITHCSNNYGPRQYPEKLIPHMIACALAGKKLPVYGDGKNVRDWIHVEDHVAGLFLALEQGKPGECYNFGGETEIENLTLVETLCDLLDECSPRADGISYKTQIAFVTDRLGHDRRYAIDNSKVQAELGFTCRHSFTEGLSATLAWYLEHQDWVKKVLQKNGEEAA